MENTPLWAQRWDTGTSILILWLLKKEKASVMLSCVWMDTFHSCHFHKAIFRALLIRGLIRYNNSLAICITSESLQSADCTRCMVNGAASRSEHFLLLISFLNGLSRTCIRFWRRASKMVNFWIILRNGVIVPATKHSCLVAQWI